MTLHVMREGQCANADTWYKLTGDGAGGTLNDFVVPQGIGRAYKLSVSVGLANTAAIGTVLIKLQGTAVPHGTEVIPVAGYCGNGSATTLAIEQIEIPIDAPLKPGILEIWGCFSGGDSGTPELMVGVDMDEKPGSAYYIVREGTTGTADSWTTLAGTGTGDTNNDPVVPQGVSNLVSVIHAVGPGATAGAATYGVRLLSISGSLPSGDQYFVGPSSTAGAGTIADIAIVRPKLNICQVPVQAGGQIRVQAVMSGADQGTPEQAVGLVFA